jgi:hypothetical protein
MSEININLNKLDIYKDSICIRCGRKYPDTILNIEGVIHHNCQMLCLDRRSCEKLAKLRKEKIKPTENLIRERIYRKIKGWI